MSNTSSEKSQKSVLSKPLVVLTGANRGLGAALARELSATGYRLILHCRKADAPLPCAAMVVVRGDLRDPNVRDALATSAAMYKATVLINNAAMYSHEPIDKTNYVDMVDADLIAPILLTQEMYGTIKAYGGGQIVNINSAAGQNPGMQETAYCAAKHGLRGFSRALRLEAKKDGIRVIDFYIGAMNSTMLSHRQDLDVCIDVNEAAQVIVANLALSRLPSCQIEEVTLSRMR